MPLSLDGELINQFYSLSPPTLNDVLSTLDPITQQSIVNELERERKGKRQDIAHCKSINLLNLIYPIYVIALSTYSMHNEEGEEERRAMKEK